ncbi:hypothetical protein [uncultured Ruminococcus sp.]|uniref:hypothetical protein n=1 Tax=uncultured Ruminococcus sp. TaxID=165186 RepID=UPI0025FCE36E|nr:hypothetical protein [uncultured Ruminococcus sp.]
MYRMSKCNVILNSKPEKVIAAASASVAMAILFSGNKKHKRNRKNNKSFFSKVASNYRIADRLLSNTIARSAADELKNKQEFKTKLKDLEIIDAIPLDLSEELTQND